MELWILAISIILGAAALAEAMATGSDDTWNVGRGLAVGDTYVYEICYSEAIKQVIHPAPCYRLSLEFVARGHHSIHDDVWIVQAEYGTTRTILLIDDAMTAHATSAWDRLMTASIQNTILHLAEYGARPLDVGSIWGYIDTYYYDIPLHVSGREEGAAVLEYELVKRSYAVIDPVLAFPVGAVWYDVNHLVPQPHIIHEYSLLYHGRR